MASSVHSCGCKRRKLWATNDSLSRRQKRILTPSKENYGTLVQDLCNLSGSPSSGFASELPCAPSAHRRHVPCNVETSSCQACDVSRQTSVREIQLGESLLAASLDSGDMAQGVVPGWRREGHPSIGASWSARSPGFPAQGKRTALGGLRQHGPHRLKRAVERIQSEPQDFKRDYPQQRLIIRFAQDHRCRTFALREGYVTF